jgi:hypothetical protein
MTDSEMIKWVAENLETWRIDIHKCGHLSWVNEEGYIQRTISYPPLDSTEVSDEWVFRQAIRQAVEQ